MKNFIAKWVVAVVCVSLVGVFAGAIDWHYADRDYIAVDNSGKEHKFDENPGAGSTWKVEQDDLEVGGFTGFTLVTVTEQKRRTGLLDSHYGLGNAASTGALLFGLNALWVFPVLSLIWWSFCRVMRPS